MLAEIVFNIVHHVQNDLITSHFLSAEAQQVCVDVAEMHPGGTTSVNIFQTCMPQTLAAW